MTNFTFIKADFTELFTDAIEAEQLIFVSPKASAVLMRSILEIQQHMAVVSNQLMH